MSKTVFYGGSTYVLPILKILTPILIVTTEKNPTDPVISYAAKNKIPYISVSSLSNESVLKTLQDNITETAVLANFGLIVPKKILNLYPHGIVNVHPSLLPKYRGPTPGQSAILNGDSTSGVTLIKLDNEVDHGHIIAQRKTSLPKHYTSDDLYTNFFKLGADLLSENLEKYVKSKITSTEQDHKKATFTEKLTRLSGYFDINNPPSAEKIKRMIHAYYPWPSAWTRIQINGQEKIVKFLPEDKLQVEGKKPVSLKDFYNGYPELKPTIEKIVNT